MPTPGTKRPGLLLSEYWRPCGNTSGVKVRRIVKVNGVVNATPDFLEHTKTINGASDLLVQVFGEAGQHARLAVGYSSLPWNICLEIELIAEVGD